MSEYELKEKMINGAISAIIETAAYAAGRQDQDIPAKRALEIASEFCAKLNDLRESITE